MFARSHEVHAIDRRGRGASGDGPSYAIEREYEDVAAVVDAIAARTGGPVDVLGHSFGGGVALGAATLTANIRRLVMYESAPAVPGLDAAPPEVVARLQALEAADDRAGLLRMFLRDIVGLDEAKLAEFEASPVYPERVAAAPTVLRELTAGGPADPALARRLAAAVSIPVLQLLGSASRPIFDTATRVLDAALPDGRIVILEGQRHAAHHEAPDVFVAEVEAFLRR
jgi:pimeloyl-ACP methyl ester carboxylesterase